MGIREIAHHTVSLMDTALRPSSFQNDACCAEEIRERAFVDAT